MDKETLWSIQVTLIALLSYFFIQYYYKIFGVLRKYVTILDRKGRNTNSSCGINISLNDSILVDIKKIFGSVIFILTDLHVCSDGPAIKATLHFYYTCYQVRRIVKTMIILEVAILCPK